VTYLHCQTCDLSRPSYDFPCPACALLENRIILPFI